MAGVNDAVQAYTRPQRVNQQLVQLVVHDLAPLQDTHTHLLGQTHISMSLTNAVDKRHAMFFNLTTQADEERICDHEVRLGTSQRAYCTAIYEGEGTFSNSVWTYLLEVAGAQGLIVPASTFSTHI